MDTTLDTQRIFRIRNTYFVVIVVEQDTRGVEHQIFCLFGISQGTDLEYGTSAGDVGANHITVTRRCTQKTKFSVVPHPLHTQVDRRQRRGYDRLVPGYGEILAAVPIRNSQRSPGRFLPWPLQGTHFLSTTWKPITTTHRIYRRDPRWHICQWSMAGIRRSLREWRVMAYWR